MKYTLDTLPVLDAYRENGEYGAGLPGQNQ